MFLDSRSVQHGSGSISATQVRRFDVRSYWQYDAQHGRGSTCDISLLCWNCRCLLVVQVICKWNSLEFLPPVVNFSNFNYFELYKAFFIYCRFFSLTCAICNVPFALYAEYYF